ncbi:MAG: hypothetical protein H7330_03830 [Hymenobacteraceae bacterium]|nr:hypothetical protein [Hymenobacteraceae bacterium]
MKKVLFMMFAAASFTFASCDSPKENAAEGAAENVEAAGEAKADAMEEGADAVRDSADMKADKMEDNADKMDGAGAATPDAAGEAAAPAAH